MKSGVRERETTEEMSWSSGWTELTVFLLKTNLGDQCFLVWRRQRSKIRCPGRSAAKSGLFHYSYLARFFGQTGFCEEVHTCAREQGHGFD